MSTRRKLKQDVSILEGLITTFQENKVEADRFKKVADSYNKQIKEIMIDNNLTEYIGGDLKASISITKREDFNELQAIEILRENIDPEIFNNVVKTKEYIDFDALEDAAYNKIVDVSILSPCTTPKEPTITLRVTKAKK